jgi:hypothetical protein
MASFSLVSYSNSSMTLPVVELVRAVPRKVTTAPHSGRVVHAVISSDIKAVGDTAIHSECSLEYTHITLL